MDRRNFLFGMLATPFLTGDGGLVIRADPTAVQAFQGEVNDPVMIGRPTALPESQGLVGMMLFDHKHQPVAVVTRVDVSREVVETTDIGDTYQKFTPGPLTVTLTAVHVGPAKMRVGFFSSR